MKSRPALPGRPSWVGRGGPAGPTGPSQRHPKGQFHGKSDPTRTATHIFTVSRQVRPDQNRHPHLHCSTETGLCGFQGFTVSVVGSVSVLSAASPEGERGETPTAVWSAGRRGSAPFRLLGMSVAAIGQL